MKEYKPNRRNIQPKITHRCNTYLLSRIYYCYPLYVPVHCVTQRGTNTVNQYHHAIYQSTRIRRLACFRWPRPELAVHTVPFCFLVLLFFVAVPLVLLFPLPYSRLSHVAREAPRSSNVFFITEYIDTLRAGIRVCSKIPKYG